MHAKYLMILPALALTACATPREQCLSAATRDARINAILIAETEANINRGFAVRIEERVRERRALCRGETEAGESVVTRCEKVDVRRVKVPEAIDLNAERAKLRSLRQQQAELTARTQTATQQCQALYPE